MVRTNYPAGKCDNPDNQRADKAGAPRGVVNTAIPRGSSLRPHRLEPGAVPVRIGSSPGGGSGGGGGAVSQSK